MVGRRALFALAGLALVAALAWWLTPPLAVTPVDRPAADATPAAAPATAPLAPDAGPRTAAATATPANDELGPVAKGLQWHVRLRGLHAKAPWTAALHCRFEGRDDVAQQWLSSRQAVRPDADGRATLAIPDWCTAAVAPKCRIEARDANYRPLQYRSDGVPDLGRELVLDVQVIAVLEGRVVDTAQTPVAAARVTAFARRDDDAPPAILAQTNTRVDGSFELAAPPDTPLLLLVAPLRRNPGRVRTSADGGEPDDGRLRDDLLPATTEVRAEIGRRTAVGDIVLAGAARITGSVQWLDGEKIPGALVRSVPADGVRFAIGTPFTAVHRTANGLVPGTTMDCDARGEFVLPGVPGVAVDLEVAMLAPRHGWIGIVGAFRQRVTPPQRADFALPRPVTLRTTDGARAVADARVEIEGAPAAASDEHGALALVLARPVRVRAAHQRLRSPWLDVPTSAAGTTVELVMTNARVELAIEFEGDFRVRNAIVTWRRDDGVEGREQLLRDDRAGAFQVFLEPGRYHISAGPGGGERNGVFLLPAERDVDLDAGPQALTLPALFGGTFTVMATDSSGVWVAGRCELRDRSGADVTSAFALREGGGHQTGRDGELLAGGVNEFTRILPPGDYELMCDFGAHGAHREIVKIRPREIGEVRIRLP